MKWPDGAGGDMSNWMPNAPLQSTKCANCNIREGTTKWIGEGGALSISHGWYSMWCELCITRAQLKYAIEQANRIPELIAELQELEHHEHGT